MQLTTVAREIKYSPPDQRQRDQRPLSYQTLILLFSTPKGSSALLPVVNSVNTTALPPARSILPKTNVYFNSVVDSERNLSLSRPDILFIMFTQYIIRNEPSPNVVQVADNDINTIRTSTLRQRRPW